MKLIEFESGNVHNEREVRGKKYKQKRKSNDVEVDLYYTMLPVANQRPRKIFVICTGISLYT